MSVEGRDCSSTEAEIRPGESWSESAARQDVLEDFKKVRPS